MCSNPNYFLRLKPEFDLKYKRTGIKSKLIFVCTVRDAEIKPDLLNNYSKDKYDLIVCKCGKCMSCRLLQSRTKACQSICEAQSHKNNCMITLTFGHDQTYKYIIDKQKKKSYYLARKKTNYLEWTLENDEFPKFMKRLRYWYEQYQAEEFIQKNDLQFLLLTKTGKINKKMPIKLLKEQYNFKPDKIRFMHCGEYGSKGSRPHHHSIIYGLDFSKLPETKVWFDKNHKKHYRNRYLEDLWQFGYSLVDSCSYNSCAYVARYCTKKITGVNSDKYYNGRKPEYCTQSNRNGLGYQFFHDNWQEILALGKLKVYKGKNKFVSVPIPKYYKKLLKDIAPVEYEKLVEDNIQKGIENFDKIKCTHNLIDVLDSRKKLDIQIFNRYVRSFENEDINYNELVQKAKAFGIPENAIQLYKMLPNNIIELRSYKDFYKRSTNFMQKEMYKQFESGRKRLINRVLSNPKLNDNVRLDMLSIYQNMNNPYKCKKRGVIYDVVKKDLNNIMFIDDKEYNVA